jgi:hypothetical protein
MKSLFLGLLLSVAAGADPLGQLLSSFSGMQQGRIQFEIKPASGQFVTTGTLAFRRPDRFHYWSKLQPKEGPELISHCWLDQKRFWVWTSQWGQGKEAVANAYYSEDCQGGIQEGPVAQALGPANFVSLLLSGQREFFEIDPKKKNDPAVWTSDGDQLLVDPKTSRLLEVVAWQEHTQMARAKVRYDEQAPSEEELGWTLPADSKVVQP